MKKYLLTTLNLILVSMLILFVLALIQPTKAVYVSNIFISYLYIVLTSISNFLIQVALNILNMSEKLVSHGQA